ncbi:MAG: HAD family hydrolase [Elusimicrobiota bacterium]
MGYSAVVFDLDGTLLDTLDDLADSVNAALRARSLEEHPTAAYKVFVGEGVARLVEQAFPEREWGGGLIDLRVNEVRAEYAKRMYDKTRPYPGVAELLGGLAARGVPMAVLSNKPQEYTQKTVDKLLADWKFALVRGALPDVPLKPDPAGALALAKELGLPPEKFLYLGDTGTDMKTATAAGMYAVGALWGFREEAELRDNGAQKLIRRPPELLQLL